MNLKDFEYNLPKELIAQEPTDKRENSRLMVLFCKEKRSEHCYFKDITGYLRSGDILVVNDTRVIPARLKGVKKSGGGKVEILLVHERGTNLWDVFVRPGRKVRVGDVIQFGNQLSGIVKEVTSTGRLIEFIANGDFKKILEDIGEVPLPHYIKRTGPPTPRDKVRYQTVYASKDGAIAAPTAGLHFSSEIMQEILKKGVDILTITLHVGPGTFRPIRLDDISTHKMESEYFEISGNVFNKIVSARKSCRRVIAVGTSTVRALESAVNIPGFTGGKGWTDLYIYPGYKFKIIDGLITNFHLPHSTPLVLVCAFAGRELILKSYEEAIEKRYRFLSFGDAMLILDIY